MFLQNLWYISLWVRRTSKLQERPPSPRANIHLFNITKIFMFSFFCSNLFLNMFENKIILNCVIIVATKKVGQQIFPPSFFVAVVGSGIRDGQKSGSGKNIPDPQQPSRRKEERK